MATKSLLSEAKEIGLAVELIKLGARLQMLETETSLSRERLSNLYREVRGTSPPKGLLPFSTDWFMTWQPNIHSSIFINIHRYMVKHARLTGIEAVVKAYQLYLEQMPPDPGCDALLSLTRAWTLLRFFDNKMLTTTKCRQCSGEFVTHSYVPSESYVCALCHVPSRAGKTKKLRILPLPT